MGYLPAFIERWLEGRIDPHGQHLVEIVSQVYFVLLTAISFLVSWRQSSVAIAVEIFGAGLVLLLLLFGPPWPYLQRKPIKYLPVRKGKAE